MMTAGGEQIFPVRNLTWRRRGIQNLSETPQANSSLLVEMLNCTSDFYTMYAAYQWVNSNPNIFSEFLQSGKRVQSEKQREILGVLETFVTPGGVIDVKKMMGNWFPEINANVFISHSRADKDLALGFAGALRNKGLRPFVDSCVWQHANTLLWEIDKECCETGPNLFSYEGSLITASHVHMMLATALTKMMDRCECVVFLGTENSLRRRSTKQMVNGGEGVTQSPWLFHEISMMQMLRKRPKEDHRPKLKNFSEATTKSASVNIPKFDYPVNLSGVPSLSDVQIGKWLGKIVKPSIQLLAMGVIPDNPLDTLYKVVRPHGNA